MGWRCSRCAWLPDGDLTFQRGHLREHPVGVARHHRKVACVDGVAVEEEISLSSVGHQNVQADGFVFVERTKTVEVDPVHLTLGNWAPPSSQPKPVDCHMATGAEASMNAEGVFNVWLCGLSGRRVATVAPSTVTEVLFCVATI